MHALLHACITCNKHIKVAISGKFTKIHLGDKVFFFYSEGFRKQNQLPIFMAAIGLAEVAPGTGVKYVTLEFKYIFDS